MTIELEAEMGIDGPDALSGSTPQECFRLGVEFMAFFVHLVQFDDFEFLVAPENVARLTRACHRHNRAVTVRWVNDDQVRLHVQ